MLRPFDDADLALLEVDLDGQEGPGVDVMRQLIEQVRRYRDENAKLRARVRFWENER